MKVVTTSPAETRALGARLGRLMAPGDIIALIGGLGAGKTVLVQGIAAGLGLKGYITSPTYLIIKEHRGEIPLYHMDAYRLAGPEELEELGYEEYFFGRGVTAIEWADRIRALLPPEYLRLDMGRVEDGGDEDRSLLFTPYGERYTILLEELKHHVDLGP